MIKKEISEIRKQCNKSDYSFTRLCGCYVHGEEKEMSQFSCSFYTLPEDDAHKYIDIFRKGFSGTLNKNLFNVPFGYNGSGDTVRVSIHEALDILVHTGLDDEDALDILYGAIVQSYEKAENYVILLTHNRYDIPGKAKDGTEMEDASDEVYSYISCAICPVSLSKPGLAYQEKEGGFASLERDWVAGMPEAAFLYPSFNDRSTDTGEVLYYSSDAKHLKEDFIGALFGSQLPMPADMQKTCFAELLEEVFNGPLDYKNICEVKDCLDEIVLDAEEAGGNGQAGMLDSKKARAVLETVTDRKIGEAEFSEAAERAAWRKTGLYAGNLTDVKTFEIRTPGVTVQVDEGKTGRPEVKQVDGRNCIVIPIEGDMEVNGILAKP